MIDINELSPVLIGAVVLSAASMAVAQDTGIVDGSFDSGSSGAWMKTDYDPSDPTYEPFRVRVLSEDCGDVARQGFVSLKITGLSSGTWFDESPKLWQDGIRLEDCDQGTHAILRFDRRILNDIDFNGLRVSIEAYSDLGDLIDFKRRRLISGVAPNCNWTTDEIALEIPDVEGEVSYRVIFEMLPWGVCGGTTYAEVDLDQVEFFRGVPGTRGDDLSAPCGDPLSGRIFIDVGTAPVETELFHSEPTARDYRRVVIDPKRPETCLSVGFGECLEEWPTTTVAFTPATETCVPSPCPADFNGDRLVDGADLAYLLGSWGTADPAADINGNGLVDGADLSVTLGTWGPCSNP